MEKKSKEFLENFITPIKYNEVASQLIEISKQNLKHYNCFCDVKITFDESCLFGKSASIKNNHISFNKTRLEILNNMKIDCYDDNHLTKIYKFYNSYEEKNHTEQEKCLYDFMKKYIDNGFERYFSQMGSYKTIKYELLDTIFHENQHIIQNIYKQYLDDIDNCPKDSKTLVLIFTMFFNEIYEYLLKNKVEFDYKRENYIFPIEFDARYEAMIKLNHIKEKYFSLDKSFSKYIVKSSLIPQKFDIEKTANMIFKDFENIYQLYFDNINSNKFKRVYNFIKSYKQTIIKEIVKRYEEMIDIVQRNAVIE